MKTKTLKKANDLQRKIKAIDKFYDELHSDDCEQMHPRAIEFSFKDAHWTTFVPQFLLDKIYDETLSIIRSERAKLNQEFDNLKDE